MKADPKSLARVRLLRDFLIPHLDRRTFRKNLEWMDRQAGVFRMLWRHQGSARWALRDACVFVAWAEAKGLWDASDRRAATKCKQRLRAALLKLKHVRLLHAGHDFRVYQISGFLAGHDTRNFITGIGLKLQRLRPWIV